jgi:hypothetical protein
MSVLQRRQDNECLHMLPVRAHRLNSSSGKLLHILNAVPTLYQLTSPIPPPEVILATQSLLSDREAKMICTTGCKVFQ